MAIKIETTIWIDRTPAEVFDFMTDATQLAHYVPGLRSASREGEPGVGTQVRAEMSILGSSFEILSEWTRFEPGVALASKNVEGMKAELLSTLVAENGGTRLDRVLHLEPEGFFASLAAPIIRRTTERNAHSELAGMKDLLESQVVRS